jgi:6-pyruvoyltetrahydropterin/6-carboxytetrahydropterin synthase
LDECGFVVDVGELDFVKKFLQQTFDHTFLVSQDDPYLECFQSRLENDLGAAKIVVVPDCSMEGLAKYVYWQVMNLLPEKDRFGRGLAISAVTCWEDEKNSCTFTPTFETPQ